MKRTIPYGYEFRDGYIGVEKTASSVVRGIYIEYLNGKSFATLITVRQHSIDMLNLSESRQPHLSDSRLTVTVTNGKQPSDRLSETIPISDVCCLIAKPEVSSAPVMTLISSKTSAFASKTYARIQIDSQRWSQKAFSFTKLWKRNRSNS